jgi:hypothetical protein
VNIINAVVAIVFTDSAVRAACHIRCGATQSVERNEREEIYFPFLLLESLKNEKKKFKRVRQKSYFSLFLIIRLLSCVKIFE